MTDGGEDVTVLTPPIFPVRCDGMVTSPRLYAVRRGSDLGAAVAEARRARGLTQAELAAQLGVDRTYVAAIERGRSNRLMDHLLRALRRLGAEVVVTWPATRATDDADG